MSERIARGARAERAALAWLRRKGLELVTRNYRCRWGELDLIMLDAETLVVVEVRARRSTDFMTPAQSIGGPKQGRIMRTIDHFLNHTPAHAHRAVRIDVVAISGDDLSNFEWISDAFGPGQSAGYQY